MHIKVTSFHKETHSYFQFDGDTYQQSKFMAIGMLCDPTYATIFMDNLVNKTKSIAPGRKLLKAILKHKLKTDSMTRVPI